MPNYRRAVVPGGTFFLTIVTYRREPIFAVEANVAKLRDAIRAVMCDRPFAIPAAVVLPDHAHFLWSLPAGDSDYSRRVGQMKVRSTHALRLPGHQEARSAVGPSRRKHREGDVWHRRFWEHAIRDEDDFERHAHYIHYNPVRHGLAACPHLWPYSSFSRWVRAGHYPAEWGCCCDGRQPSLPTMARLDDLTGE